MILAKLSGWSYSMCVQDKFDASFNLFKKLFEGRLQIDHTEADDRVEDGSALNPKPWPILLFTLRTIKHIYIYIIYIYFSPISFFYRSDHENGHPFHHSVISVIFISSFRSVNNLCFIIVIITMKNHQQQKKYQAVPTGCSLNIVFFQKILEYSVLCLPLASVCVHTPGR